VLVEFGLFRKSGKAKKLIGHKLYFFLLRVRIKNVNNSTETFIWSTCGCYFSEELKMCCLLSTCHVA